MLKSVVLKEAHYRVGGSLELSDKANTGDQTTSGEMHRKDRLRQSDKYSIKFHGCPWYFPKRLTRETTGSDQYKPNLKTNHLEWRRFEIFP